MQKGKWVFKLIILVLKGTLSPIESFNWAAARVKPKPLSVSLRGVKFEKVDHTFWGIITDVFLNQVYNPPEYAINKNDIVLDIGAHKGAFTAYAALEGAGKIISYEPNPENFNDLRDFITKNQFNNVVIHQKGVGAKTGETNLFLSTASSRHSITSPEKLFGKHENLPVISIKTLSLTDCINAIDRVDFLKMDCEDAEREILLNTSHKVLAKIKKISVEIHKPVDSTEIKDLVMHLKGSFSHIELLQPKNSQFGYIYARL